MKSISCIRQLQLLLLLSAAWSLPLGLEQQDYEGMILKHVQKYEYLRFSTDLGNITRSQNVDLVRDSTNTRIPICHFAMIMPFSAFRASGERIPLNSGSYQGMAALLLAVEHLNSGNGIVVEQVQGLNNRCPIRFTTEMFDSAMSEKESVNHVVDIVTREPEKELLPCAFLGAYRSAVTKPTSTITGLRGFPHVSPLSSSIDLDEPQQFPLFGRTIPTDLGTACTAVEYLRHMLDVKHFAILHVNDAYGNSYAHGLQLAAADLDMEVISINFPFAVTKETAEVLIRQLKETKFRYFFAIIFGQVHYEIFMTEAHKQGIAGTGRHTWVFTDSTDESFFTIPRERGSPLHLASIGTLRVAPFGGMPGSSKPYDNFMKSMQELAYSPADMQFLDVKRPTHSDQSDYQPLNFTVNPQNFMNKASEILVPFMYDAAIALGLAACEVTATNSGNNMSFFDGEAHFNAFKTTTFHGATGENIYNPTTGTRDPSSAQTILLNFQPANENMGKNSTLARLQKVTVGHYHFGEWRQLEPTIFNDNTTVPPPDLPPVDCDYNYIGVGFRVGGLAMASLVLVTSIAFIIWTHTNVASRVVIQSQPFFLDMVSVGCFLMGFAILFLSLDDQIANSETLAASCVAIPWLVTVGWVIAFSALFAKTNRINQIFQPRRVTVTVWDVMKPVVSLMGACVTNLILWTILDRPTWEREPTGFDEYGRATESQGQCSYMMPSHEENGLPFIIALAIILICVPLYSLYQAYNAREISSQYAESEFITMILAMVVIMSFISFPFMILAQSHHATFFVLATLVFVVSMAILLLIFIPKVRYHRKQKRRSRVAHVYVTGIDPSSQHVSCCEEPKQGPLTDTMSSHPANSTVSASNLQAAGMKDETAKSESERSSEESPEEQSPLTTIRCPQCHSLVDKDIPNSVDLVDSCGKASKQIKLEARFLATFQTEGETEQDAAETPPVQPFGAEGKPKPLPVENQRSLGIGRTLGRQISAKCA